MGGLTVTEKYQDILILKFLIHIENIAARLTCHIRRFIFSVDAVVSPQTAPEVIDDIPSFKSALPLYKRVMPMIDIPPPGADV